MRPPTLADWILRRVLPLGKRGESILGDLREEFRSHPSRLWYWRQTIALTLQYLTHDSPQSALTYPRSTPMWFDLRSDLRAALRTLRRTPGTSTVIVATLALAIGAATIGFAFADFALFRGLPVDDPSRVVSVFTADAHGSNPRARVSAPDLLDYRARTTTLVHLSGMREGRVPLIRNGRSQTLTAGFVTANAFPAMGQHAAVGRIFHEGEDVPGADPVVVLAHHYWRDEMQSRRDAIGRTLQIGRTFYTIVGVMSPQIEFGNLAEPDVWLPLSLSAEEPRDQRNLRFIARLKDGVSFEQAAAEMASIGAALATEHPLTNGGWTTTLVPIRDITGGQGFWVVIALFLLSMGLLVAIATANVSNLIMVRAASRARELAVRSAMGARGSRLLRQFIVEGLVLAALGAAISLPVAWLGLQGIAAVNAEPAFQQIAIDVHELSFVASLALICPIVFSLASARQIRSPDLRSVLAAQGGRGATARMRGRSALVVAQVALAVVLLTATAFVFKSINYAFSQPLGMAVDRLLIFTLEFNEAVYPDVDAARAAADATRTAVAGLPGVIQVAAVNALPVLGDTGMVAITIDEHAVAPGEASPTAVVTGADANAMQTLGVPLRAGRWWSEGTMMGAVITQAAAERYFGGVQQAVGRTVSFQRGHERVSFQIVGVSGDVANLNRTMLPPPRIWIPMPPATRRFAFIVEAEDPAAVASGVRTVAASVAPSVAVESLQTLAEAMDRAKASDYVIIFALAGFAVVALILATAGLFGVISYSVSQRTPELGTRMALGASASAVVALVARQSLTLIGIGLLIGLAGGVTVGFGMQSMLFGTSPIDPVTLASVSGLLMAVSLLATAIPAWRASRIDPVIALRSE
ncbi:MAG TPA: ADOP family duplicated permease [Vicinamibacterales bacterium]|nr:ADOP family duplicated permease [Vicinamibacterales bacterium]